MKPTPRTVHHLALIGAAGMSGIALFDAGTKALTGHLSVFSDDSDVEWLVQTSNAVHGMAYVAMLAVLVVHRRLIVSVNRVARVSYWLLRGSVTALAAGFLVLMPFLDPENIPAALGAVVGVVFIVMLLSGPVLGIAVRRTSQLRPGSLLLVAMIPVLGLTILVGVLAPAFGHPAYLETALAFGLALLGYRASSDTVATGAAAADRAAV
jgi:uncharacterized membrane protein YhaH (DUF805 family)